MIHDECGLFGIYGHADASRLTYFGLYAQQHRGQESAGIVSIDEDGTFHSYKGMGLVPDIFEEKHLQALPGNVAVGHVRYSTTGRPSLANAQPLHVNYKGKDIAIAHNGNLVNTFELRSALEDKGAIFRGTSDTEVIMHLFASELCRGGDMLDAVRRTCMQLKGAFCLIFLMEGTMVCVRDPFGFHPLSIGHLDGAFVAASETCAFDLMDAEYERSLKPGEMYIVSSEGESSQMLDDIPARPRQCIFELIYFARPDSYIYGEQVYTCRKNMGWQLAHESTPDVDFVMPFPDSGVYPAVGFAQCAELPYEHAMIRNHYVGRTFIQPSQGMRSFGVRVKINPVRAMIDGKRICIVDDSIVRGTTMITRVKKLRELGAKEVHIRISCPPVRHPCFYGIDFASPKELIAANYTLEEIQKKLDVDSLHYLSIDGLLRSVMHNDSYCLACFNGEYPVPPCRQCGKHQLEKKRS
ncbi:MAG: amidophosphoribosyltransferase [Desulfovibrio sp.]|nr:amidophosphoribosyltransferase [Desulfovibrio sp.]